MVSAWPAVRKKMPFALWEFPDFLAPDTYVALEREYPGSSSDWVEAPDKLDTKIDISSANKEFNQVLDASPTWRSYVEHLSSELFSRDLINFCWPSFTDYLRRGLVTNPTLAQIISTSTNREDGVRRLNKVLRPEMHFSIMRSRDQNTPHTDGHRKVISLIFYLPHPDWREEYGGRTLFYRVPDDYSDRPWFSPVGNRIAPAHLSAFLNDVTLGHATAYKANSLGLFVRSAISYHSVPPICSPPNLPRRTFLYTLKFPT
jgi:hypothetical protein